MNQEKIGKFIKDIRQKHNLTQKDLADKLGVTFQAVSKWENGKNIPDIAVLRDISKLFDINIDEILSGESKNKEKKKVLYYVLGGIFIFILIILFTALLGSDRHDFEFKQISTSCDNFNITGSMAYNRDKTSLYISSVEFCGSDDSAIYESIECALYESHEEDDMKISSCKSDKNVTLEEYLKDVRISVSDYRPNCLLGEDEHLYLEINATLKDNKNVVYKVPITLSDNCSN